MLGGFYYFCFCLQPPDWPASDWPASILPGPEFSRDGLAHLPFFRLINPPPSGHVRAVTQPCKLVFLLVLASVLRAARTAPRENGFRSDVSDESQTPSARHLEKRPLRNLAPRPLLDLPPRHLRRRPFGRRVGLGSGMLLRRARRMLRPRVLVVRGAAHLSQLQVF